MNFIALQDVDGREVRVNPASVSMLRALAGDRIMICLGTETHAVVVEGNLDGVEALLTSAEPPPAPDPTMALVS